MTIIKITSIRSCIRIQSQHPILSVVLTEIQTFLAKGQYTIYSTGTPKPPNEIRCLGSTANAPKKKPHPRLINLICHSPLWLLSNF